VAWYDAAEPKPALPDLVARKLRLLRPVVESKEAFASAYGEVKRGAGNATAESRTGASEGVAVGEAPAAAGAPADMAAGGFLRSRPAGATDAGFAATRLRPLGAEHFAGLRGISQQAATPGPIDARLAMAADDRPKTETREELGIVLQPFSQYGPAREGSQARPGGREEEPRAQPRYAPRIEPYPFSGYLDPYYYAPYWPVYYGGLWGGAVAPGAWGYGVGYYPVVSWYPIRGTTLSVGGTFGGGSFVTVTGKYTNVPINK
jgi:hypothetical protein